MPLKIANHATPNLWAVAVFFVLLTLASCSHYQYVTVSSSLEQGEDKDFYVQNDSVLVWFSFNGYNGPVTIEINNKLQQPLYIDWSKSSIIINGESYNFNENNPIGFIPPTSYINHTPTLLQSSFFPLSRNDNGKRVNIYSLNGIAGGTQFHFDHVNSPLAFRCFLTLSTNEDLKEAFYFDSNFWASEVTKATVPPESMIRRGDQFFIKELTGFGNFMLGTAAVILIVLGAIAEG